MTFDENSAFSAHAAHCCHQAKLSRDDKLKQYWEEMANGWLALADALVEKDRYGKPTPPR